MFFRLGRYNEAIEKLTETYSKNHNFHDALLSRGNTYVDFGTPESFLKAQKDYELAIVKNSKNLDAHVNLAYLFQMTGKFMKAWQQFTYAIQIKSGFKFYFFLNFFLFERVLSNQSKKILNWSFKFDY